VIRSESVATSAPSGGDMPGWLRERQRLLALASGGELHTSEPMGGRIRGRSPRQGGAS
jgi:hypothetical protein